MIAAFGKKTRMSPLQLFNNCVTPFTITKIWKTAKVVVLLKPGKDPESPKSYRPISLLCNLYKLYERMILSRIIYTVEKTLALDLAGLRPGIIIQPSIELHTAYRR